MHISVNTAVTSNLEMSVDERYGMIAAAGFTAIDIGLGGGASTRNLDYEGKCIFEKSIEEVKEYYKETVDAIRKHGLFVTQAHAPQPAYIGGHPEVTEYCIRIYKRIIEFCGYIGCPRLVIHGVDYKFDNTTDKPADIDRLNRHLFESLIPELLKYNVTACMENLYVRKYKTDNADLFIEGPACDTVSTIRLIDELNELAGKEVFGLCLDTGHMHIVRKDARSFITAYGKRIKALHLNDNHGFADQHLVPLAGTADWENIFNALEEIGYEGDINFELGGGFGKISAVDSALVVPWLELVYKTGVYLRGRLEK